MSHILNVSDWQTIRFIDIFSVSSQKAGTECHYFGHTDLYQLAFKIKGTTAIVYNGKPLDFSPNHAVYLPKETRPDIEYHKRFVSEGSSICLFFVAPCFLNRDAFSVPLPQNTASSLFHKLLWLWKSGKKDDFSLYSVFFELLSLVNAKLSDREKHPAFLREATEYLQAHACDAFIDFDMLAAHYGISADRFRRIFKRAENVSPLGFIAQIRLERIRTLLRETELSFTEIAGMTGFSDLNYFSRFFKKHTGVSASEYKYRYRGLF